MPPRPALHRRLATALLALVYFLAWGEPVALHPCPMHDGAGVAVVAPAGHQADAVHGRHAAHASTVDHGAPANPHEQDEHLCQCLGHGCCTAVVTAPAAQQVRWFAVVTRRADPPADAAHPAPRAAAPRLLPPATGPPRLT